MLQSPIRMLPWPECSVQYSHQSVLLVYKITIKLYTERTNLGSLDYCTLLFSSASFLRDSNTVAELPATELASSKPRYLCTVFVWYQHYFKGLKMPIFQESKTFHLLYRIIPRNLIFSREIKNIGMLPHEWMKKISQSPIHRPMKSAEWFPLNSGVDFTIHKWSDSKASLGRLGKNVGLFLFLSIPGIFCLFSIFMSGIKESSLFWGPIVLSIHFYRFLSCAHNCSLYVLACL